MSSTVERQAYGADFSDRATVGICGRQPGELLLTVVFTTIPGTLEALRKGAHLAHQLGVKIRILVPFVVPYPLDLDKPGVNLKFRLRRLRTVCERQAVETCIDVRLCRGAHECVQQILLPHSLVLIGGHKTFWPLSREKRLATSLKRAGHEVIFVEHLRPPLRMFPVIKAKSHHGYSRARLIAIIFIMSANSTCTAITTLHHRYPLGIGPILLLIPGLLRELDLRGGRSMRRLGPFEWSCLAAGLLFLAALPFFLT